MHQRRSDPDATTDLARSAADQGAAPRRPDPARPDPTRLDPGVVLASRYRIIAPLGKGGMGEVYRADDLELSVPIALKFLPASLAADPVRLDRLRAEVRTARQVSHPNVCRVYDIAQAPADSGPPRSFITMEFVDGEDLSSLLTRIGRLPPDKAVQIARQVCFGLAAAHEQGLVHRDLKPANIMLDARGNARIMDFGVAGLASQINADGAIAAGTPIYMAPEQLESREVTSRSDLYALGHVLYELFTGKPVYARTSVRTIDDIRALHRSGTTVTRPSEHVDLDPAVERVILHCLETDPAARPQSAIAVAAALPGGDPLAAALAAGETPSPELVALAGKEAGVRRSLAWAAVAAIAFSIIALAALNDRFAIHRRVPFALPPDALAARCRELARSFSAADPPRYEAWSFSYDNALVNTLRESGDAARWTDAADGDPAAIRFWYRAAADRLIPTGWWEKLVGPWSPPRTEEGVYLATDTAGRLLRYDRVAPAAGLAATPAPPPPDWSPFFKAADLDQPAFTAAPPRIPPLMPADSRAAWTGPTLRDSRPLLISAASLDGVPVFFDRRPDEPAAAPDSPSPVDQTLAILINASVSIGVIAAVLFARHNVRARRGDRAGAWRIAVFTFAVEYLAMVLARNSLADLFVADNLGRPLARALWMGAFAWVFYIALEPLVRRLWPQLMISWSRLIAGSWRDPLVARHTLLGLAAGALTAAVFASAAVIRINAGALSTAALTPTLNHVLGLRFSLSHAFTSTAATVALGLLLSLLAIGLKRYLKRPWIVTPILAVCFAVLYFGAVRGQPHLVAASLFCGSVLALILVREGILPLSIALLTSTLFVNLPFTLDLNAWYASTALVYSAAAMALAVYCALNATRSAQRTA